MIKNIFSRTQSKDRTDLLKSIGPILILAQSFAILPMSGILSSDLRFQWISFRMIYSLYNLSGSICLAGMNFYRFMTAGMNFGDIVTVIFFLGTISIILLFFKIAYDFPALNKKWLQMEKAFINYDYVPNLGLRFKITAAVVLILAFAEHLLFISKLVFHTMRCPLMKTEPLKAYFGVAFSQVFAVTSYAYWKAILMEILNIMATFAWNFMDLFIIMMCAAIAERFKQINKQVFRSGVKNKQFWIKIRQDYNMLSLLCQDLNLVVGHLVTVSFGNNLFFICVQIFNTLKPLVGVMETVYFVCSFGFLLGRTAVVSVYSCWINDESKKMMSTLFDVPSEHFSVEIARLTQQISTCPVALSGSDYFYITRSLCLKVAGAVITFELILQQIGPLWLHTDHNVHTDVFCVT